MLIGSNGLLTSIAGFSNLASIAGSLEISNDPKLTVLDATNGFEKLDNVGAAIQIFNNAALQSIGGFTLLKTANAEISIHDNGVRNIAGFPAITDVVGNLSFYDNPQLQTVAGFTSLAQLGGSLVVRDNDALTQFNGLDSLANIGLNLTVVSNPVLASIAGLRSGTLQSGSLGNLYQIGGNPALSSCEVNALRTTLNTTNDLSGANSGCTTCNGVTCSAGAGTTAGQSGKFTGDAVIVNAADLVWMKNVIDLDGSLKIESTALPNVNGLQNLKTVSGNVTITNNSGITNVGGLAGLTTVDGNMDVSSNGALINVNGLAALKNVGGNLQVAYNTLLASMGLTGLNTVDGSLSISSNNALTNLDGLVNLTSVGTTTNHNLDVYSNASLTSIKGLIKPAAGTGKLATVAGSMTIANNAFSECQAAALQTSLGSGLGGSLTQYGNVTCATSCVAANCQ